MRVGTFVLAASASFLQCSKLDERDLNESQGGTAGSNASGNAGTAGSSGAGASGRGGSSGMGGRGGAGGASAGTGGASGATGGGSGEASGGSAGDSEGGMVGSSSGGEGAEPGTGGGSGAGGDGSGDAGAGNPGECADGNEEACSTACGAGTRVCSMGAWGPCTQSCGEALDAQGSCADGRVTCDGTAWGACSITPATRDSCAPGNDDTCDGQPYTGCTCGSFVMPNPASSTLPNPASYTASSETVTDDRTGLIWERGSSPDQLTLGQASTYCSQLDVGGASDWRLPSILELVTLLDFTRTSGPMIDAAAFPDTVRYNYWSATPVEGSAGDLWQVGFDAGYVSTFPSDFTIWVRCVRASGSRCYPSGARFQVREDSVYDAATGLTWQKAVSNQVTFANAAAQCANPYRLPSYKELATLVDFARAAPGPMIDTASFPSTPAELFWSSTLTPTSSIYAFTVDFATGAAADRDTSSGQTRLRVRCVQ